MRRRGVAASDVGQLRAHSLPVYPSPLATHCSLFSVCGVSVVTLTRRTASNVLAVLYSGYGTRAAVGRISASLILFVHVSVPLVEVREE